MNLLSALRDGNIDLLRALHQEDQTQLYRKTVKGNSIFHIAAVQGCLWPVIEAFPGASLDLLLHRNANGDTWLHCAVRAGQDLTPRPFMTSHVWGLLMGVLNERGDSALHEAARYGRADVVRRLLEASPDMAAVVNKDGESPVYLAAVKGSVEAVGILLGCETVEYGGPKGKTALHAAVCRSNDIANMLLEKKPELNHQVDASLSAPIHYAASLGDEKMVRFLLQMDASVAYLRDNGGLSAMHIAASMDYANVIEEILQHCPDANELTDDEGKNFLHLAIKNNATTVVRLVLGKPQLRQSLLEADYEGNTPLHLAVINHNTKFVRLLILARKDDTNVTNRNGFTTLDLAASSVESNISHRMGNIMEELASAGSMFGPQRMDLIMVKHQRSRRDEKLNRGETLVNNLGIVAGLIATVTFAAAFTLPGGYVNDESSQEEGMVLAKKPAFKVFLIFDTIAMMSSICVIWQLMNTGSLDNDIRLQSINSAMKLIWIALGGMVVAFSMAIYVVLVSKCRWLAILVCAMVIFLPCFAWFINNWQIVDFHLLKRQIKIYKTLQIITSIIEEDNLGLIERLANSVKQIADLGADRGF